MKHHSLLAAPLLSTRWAHEITWAAALLALTVQASGAEATLVDKAKQYFKPLPQDMATAEFPTLAPRVALGKKLFFDPRLSADGTVACATCHRPALYGTDALRKSIGVERRVGARNAPTVLNAALQFKAHWIGDRTNVEEQAMKSLSGRTSFGNPDNATVIRKIKALPGYQTAFTQAFPNDADPVRPENWGKAIGAYERTLVTPSPFDAYLKGDTKALTPRAQAGLKLFIEVGCVSCHNGVAVGGAMFQKFGVVGDYWKETGSQAIDEGRYQDTRDPADRYVFKVPSLRNVSMTPPYFHDGSVAGLPEAVRIMARLQLGRRLGEKEVSNIVAFLDSLTGDLPANFQCAAPAAFPVCRWGERKCTATPWSQSRRSWRSKCRYESSALHREPIAARLGGSAVGYFRRLGATMRCSRRRGSPSLFQGFLPGAADLVSFRERVDHQAR